MAYDIMAVPDVTPFTPEANTFSQTRKDYGTISSLLGQGMTNSWLQSLMTGDKKNLIRGSYIDPQDVSRVQNAWTSAGNQLNPQYNKNPIPTLQDLATARFDFNMNDFLPQIQQSAAAIYDPQRAQLEALRGLKASQSEQGAIRTREDFAKRMKAEQEAINQRGAFFSGGGLNRESDIRKEESYALRDIELQQQMADADMLSQIGLLSQQQADFIKQQLYDEQVGAYGRWSDQYQRLLDVNRVQRGDFTSDRDYQLAKQQADRDYELAKKNLELQKKQLAAQSQARVYDYNYNYSGGSSGGSSSIRGRA